MADITKTLQISFDVQDTTDRGGPVVVTASGQVSASEVYPDEYRLEDISDSVSASGNFLDESRNETTTDDVNFSENDDSVFDIGFGASGVISMSDVIDHGENEIEESSDDVFLSPSGVSKNEDSDWESQLDISDSVSPNVDNINMLFKELKGTYYGRVPIDVDISDTATLEVQYLQSNVWRDALMSDNIAMPSGNSRAWWDVYSGDVTTKLRVRPSGLSEYQVSNPIFVQEDVPSVKFPYFKIEDWASYAEVTSPSGHYVAINPEGYSVRNVEFKTSQELGEFKEISYELLENITYDNTYFSGNSVKVLSGTSGSCGDTIDAGEDVEWKGMSAVDFKPEGGIINYSVRTASEQEGVESLSSKEWKAAGGGEIQYFTEVGTTDFTIPDGWKEVDVLVVAGGGGGGMDMGGGGGGGGVIYQQGISVSEGTSVQIVVGTGGHGGPAGGTEGQPTAHQFTIPATDGGNSSFGDLIAIGGGHGGSSYYGHQLGGTPGDGGSGGGTSGYSSGGTKAGGIGTVGQGYNGGRGGGQYYSGGGGGAGGAGTDSTARANGGPGLLVNIDGNGYYWAGGGGGSGYSIGGGDGGIGGGGGGAVLTSTGGGSAINSGSPGGGGSTSSQTNKPGGDAGANTGAGGGGGSHYYANNKGGEGGSGIVIIKPTVVVSESLSVDNGRYLEWRVVLNNSGVVDNDAESIVNQFSIRHDKVDYLHTHSPYNYPISFYYKTFSDWRDLTKNSIDLDLQPGRVLPDPSGNISGIIDAERTVEWGQYILDGAATLKFRTSDTENGLSGESWVSPSGSYVFPTAASGRYLEWHSDMDGANYMDSLSVWINRNKHFYSGTAQETADAGEDVVWKYIVADDRGATEYYYRGATEAEGSGALTGKSWNEVSEKYSLSDYTGRYLEWSASGTQPISVVVAHGEDDLQEVNMGEIPEVKLGDVDIRLIGDDDIRSDHMANRYDRSYLMIDDNVPTVSTYPSFIWDNSVDSDTPRRDMQYVFQLDTIANIDERNTVDINSKASTAEFDTYQSKDAAILTADNKLSLDTGTSTDAEIIYRFGDSNYHVWSRLIASDNNYKSDVGDTCYYHIRTSDDQAAWSEWKEVRNIDTFLERSKYIEVKISLVQYGGTKVPEVNSFSLYSQAGNGMMITTEGFGGTSIASFTESPLTTDTYYFYRVKAFDGSKYSMWSRTEVVYASSDGSPLAPSGLLTESQFEPVRIITFSPNFTWIFTDDVSFPPSGLQQHAQVQIGVSEGDWNMWDSGKLPTASGIYYAEPSGIGATNPLLLSRGINYYWRVRTWDDSVNNLGGPYSEATTFRMNQLPTIPIVARVED